MTGEALCQCFLLERYEKLLTIPLYATFCLSLNYLKPSLQLCFLWGKNSFATLVDGRLYLSL